MLNQDNHSRMLGETGIHTEEEATIPREEEDIHHAEVEEEEGRASPPIGSADLTKHNQDNRGQLIQISHLLQLNVIDAVQRGI